MDPRVLGPLVQPALGPLQPPHRQQQLARCSGVAALAMAITALEPNPEPWRDLEQALWEEATGGDTRPAAEDARELFPEELAAATLSRGFHVRMRASGQGVAYLEHLVALGHDQALLEEAHERAGRRAHAAGVHEQRGEPDEVTVRRGLEACHPLVLLSDLAVLREDAEPRPQWLVLVGLDDDRLLLHDPLHEGGPEEALISRLPALSGFAGHHGLLEVAPGPRFA